MISGIAIRVRGQKHPFKEVVDSYWRSPEGAFVAAALAEEPTGTGRSPAFCTRPPTTSAHPIESDSRGQSNVRAI